MWYDSFRGASFVWWFRITLLYTKGHPIFKSSLKKAKLQGQVSIPALCLRRLWHCAANSWRAQRLVWYLHPTSV